MGCSGRLWWVVVGESKWSSSLVVLVWVLVDGMLYVSRWSCGEIGGVE